MGFYKQVGEVKYLIRPLNNVPPLLSFRMGGKWHRMGFNSKFYTTPFTTKTGTGYSMNSISPIIMDNFVGIPMVGLNLEKIGKNYE